MAEPTTYEFDDDFTATDKGTQLNVQLQKVQASSESQAAAIADVRRSDGALQNEIVTRDSLAPGLELALVEGAVTGAIALATDQAQIAVSAAALAAAWAESPTAPDVNDPASQSAKTWAGVATTKAGEAGNSATAAATSAANAALFDGPKFDTIALMGAWDGFEDLGFAVVQSGFNGEPETFRYDASSTLTADGALVVTATGMGIGRLISTRKTYGTPQEVKTDKRTFPTGTVLTAGKHIYDTLPIVATAGHFAMASGQYVNLRRGPNGYDVKGLLAVGDGVTDDTLALQNAAIKTSDLYFPPVDNGLCYLMASGDLVLASTADPRNDVRLVGAHKGNNGLQTSALKFASGYGIKVNGTTYATHCLYRLVTKDLFIGPIDSVSRTTPIFDATGIAYWDRENCHFQGDTLREQPTVRLRWSLGVTSRHCNIWGGLYSEDFGTTADPVNAVDCLGDNHNDGRYAGIYACTTFKKIGGAVQSCGHGFDISGINPESTSSLVIDGVYFENNKFWDGTKFTGQDITVGGAVFVRGMRISNNYFAQLTEDNAFTSGQGQSTLSPIKIARVQGGSISDNFWTSVIGSALVEMQYAEQDGTIFPNNMSIDGNTDLFTTKAKSVAWATGVTEAQKFALMSNDSILIRDWTEKLIGVTKTVRSPLIEIAAPGDVFFPIMESKHYGKISEIRLICSSDFDLAATLSVGILASSIFYVNAYSLAAKAAYTTTVITLDNPRVLAGNGPIIGKVSASVVTTAGSFMLEIDYMDVLQ